VLSGPDILPSREQPGKPALIELGSESSDELRKRLHHLPDAEVLFFEVYEPLLHVFDGAWGVIHEAS
jgi:hypothetical protein